MKLPARELLRSVRDLRAMLDGTCCIGCFWTWQWQSGRRAAFGVSGGGAGDEGNAGSGGYALNSGTSCVLLAASSERKFPGYEILPYVRTST